MDPQQRLFLECCGRPIEGSWLRPVPLRADRLYGVPVCRLLSDPSLCRTGLHRKSSQGLPGIRNYFARWETLDFLSTRVSYKLICGAPPSFTMLSASVVDFVIVSHRSCHRDGLPERMATGWWCFDFRFRKSAGFYQDGGPGCAAMFTGRAVRYRAQGPPFRQRTRRGAAEAPGRSGS